MVRLAQVLALALLMSLLVATGVGAQEGVPLALRFAPGDVMQYQISLSGSGALTAPDGERSPAGLRGTLTCVLTVSEVRSDGSARLQCLLPTGDIDLTLGQRAFRFSYAGNTLRWYADGREYAPPPTGTASVPFAQVPLLFTLAPNGRISEVSIPNGGLMQVLQGSIPGFDLARIQVLGEPLLPDSPVTLGETWRHTSQLLPLGRVLPINVNLSSTLESFTETEGIGLATIASYAEATYAGAPASLSPTSARVRLSLEQLRATLTATQFLNTTTGRLIMGNYEQAISARVLVTVDNTRQTGSLEARLHFDLQAR